VHRVPEPARERRVGATAPAAPAGDPGGGARSWGEGKARRLVLIVVGIVALDYFTKLLVVRSLRHYDQIDLVGQFVRLTFIENTGAAFGIHIGAYDRVFFLGLTTLALCALALMYWVTPARDRLRLAAIALLCAGAIGNLIDRARSARGVVDFMDVGIGNLRWPVFNVADLAVTTGAILLAFSLWGEERRREPGP